MKLAAIRLKNFRIFQDKNFEFKPLTIFIGPNSTGKSTVVKALMLLQENLKSPSRLGYLAFDQWSHSLGDFQSILNKKLEEKNVLFELTYDNNDYRKKNKDNKHILDGVDRVKVSYEYEEDEKLPGNGLLTSFQLSVERDKDYHLILSARKREEKLEWYFDHQWFIDRILINSLFDIKPKIYKIWDKLSADDLSAELARRKGALQREKKEKLRETPKKISDQYSDLIEEIKNEINKLENIDDPLEFLEEKEVEIKKEYKEKIKKVKERIDEIEFQMEQEGIALDPANSLHEERLHLLEQIENLEQGLDKDLLELRKQGDQIVSIRIEYLEAKIREIERFINRSILEEEKKIEKDYNDLLKKTKEGTIRTELYALIKKAGQRYLNELKGSILEQKLFPLQRSTISDFLFSKEWEPSIVTLVDSKNVLSVGEALEWNEGTFFIQEVLKKLEDTGDEPLSFIELLKDEEEGTGNQLIELLVNQVYEAIQIAFQPIPFFFVAANRGMQERIYRVSKPTYYLERALALFLNIKKNNRTESMEFTSMWMREFGILSETEEFEIEVIDGDFVSAYIVDKENNRKMNIADKGLGVLQLIPIIIFAADAIGTQKLICIEEPGTYLHPNLQSKLADFIQHAISSEIYFLIETHSEYFIRKLQYLAASGKPGAISEDFNMRYFNNAKDILLYVDEYGSLVDETGKSCEFFEQKFFDEASKWHKKRMEVVYSPDYIKKRMAEGEGPKLEFKASFVVPIPRKEEQKKLDQIDKELQDPNITSERKAELKQEREEILTGLKCREKDIELAVMKTIAAFANSDGGELIIGVAENADGHLFVRGINEDIEKKGSEDELIQYFDNKVRDFFGNEMNSLIESVRVTVFEEGQEKKILIVNTKKSRSPILLKESKKERNGKTFYIRRQASTQCLSSLSEIISYCQNHFREFES